MDDNYLICYKVTLLINAYSAFIGKTLKDKGLCCCMRLRNESISRDKLLEEFC